ncbi:serine/threonine protein kinase [Archangium lansingense]|uniref:non-specific serine/threonine protein kinase n=1 Tax=Archangium lansingense TaxID=2995310 RepID=A0ABT4ALL6_9BACT|nr:serine/threonine-protein kinase [Archangium lansinium]MCY1082583.1 serine/threonine-protein kinase [Archangium lansinium]
MTDALHPDHLNPGDMVGPWLIVQVLGRGGSSRVFKVERDGRPYSLKMALLPLTQSREDLTEEQYVEEKSTYRQLAREAAALFTYSSHPNLLRVYGVDFWPNPTKGYPFLVTDFVNGDNWHQWRWRKPPHSARLVETFSSVVRTVGVLHARGVHHRDLKAENILIRREDGRPFLIDFGTVRIPGALTKTLGLPEGVLHLLPPELLAYTRSEAWKRGEPFHGGVSADLYALGVLLYQALTDLHPFDPELPDKELVAAIATVTPAAPHLLNPLAPRSLSDIAMKLLEKKPEARYPDTASLLVTLERAAEQERTSPAWKVPLTAPDSSAFEASKEQAGWNQEAVADAQAARPSENAPSQEDPQQETPPRAHGMGRRRRWLIAALAALLVLGAMGLLSGRATLASSPVAEPGMSAPNQRGNPPVLHPIAPQDSSSPRHSSRSGILAVWLCATIGLGCPAVQVKPTPANCPTEATEAMFKELKFHTASPLRALVDVNQPGEAWEMGLYKEGPVVGRITVGEGLLVEGSLLYGYLWIGPGLTDDVGREAVIGRYTKALLPNGAEYPVCIALGGPDGRMPRIPSSKSGTVQLPRDSGVNGVWRWP